MASITQRQARKILRDRTNKSHKWCEENARRIATDEDGKRMKVLDFKLDALINETNNPPAIARPKGVREISDRKARKIQSYA